MRKLWQRSSFVLVFVMLFAWSGAAVYALDAPQKKAPKSGATAKPKSTPKPKSSDKTVSVREYTRKDGTKVRAHKRRPPGTANATPATSIPSSSSTTPATDAPSNSAPAASTGDEKPSNATRQGSASLSRGSEPDAGAASTVTGASQNATPSAPPPPTASVVANQHDVFLAEEAPIFLFPDANRTPLRILPANTRLRVVEVQDGWIKGEFRDPQFGLRMGYVERRHVK